MLDIVQRHHGHVSLYSGDTTDKQDMLDILERSGVTYIVQNALLQRGVRDPSVYFRGYVEGTRAINDAAITASVCKLIYTSSTGIIFDSTDIVNVDEQVPYPEKPFNAYNDAQGVFGSRDRQIGGSRSLFDCTYDRNIVHMILLAGNELVPPPSYSSTMSSKPKLDPKCTMRKLNESLHHVLPPICATTEYHCTIHSSVWTLSPYVTPAPNAESILSTFNTPFDSHELEHPFAHSQIEGQAFCIESGGPIYCWDVTGVYNGNE
ncbi:hypothetical protein M404DRAFT_29443 [Pisolithus tinctorius Marx 270]|uniref:3-beta hydroxysteroid dehydrogenase/isomerase domain-containing protein n=1 Tax=Pisolithus tinctorius Marx 270 TaxID=870435 RepID=A0A0C3JSS6_PISTI|nr:hypothetical protein M404DRAFT_29443 [Pisolithus tinctorius Marx 270]